MGFGPWFFAEGCSTLWYAGWSSLIQRTSFGHLGSWFCGAGRLVPFGCFFVGTGYRRLSSILLLYGSQFCVVIQLALRGSLGPSRWVGWLVPHLGLWCAGLLPHSSFFDWLWPVVVLPALGFALGAFFLSPSPCGCPCFGSASLSYWPLQSRGFFIRWSGAGYGPLGSLGLRCAVAFCRCCVLPNSWLLSCALPCGRPSGLPLLAWWWSSGACARF